MIDLPDSVLNAVHQVLQNIGDPDPIVQVRSQGGGCINNASQVVTQKNKYFLKWNANPLPGMFTTEAYGLKLLKSIGEIRVPEVIKAQEAGNSTPAFILQEWIEQRTGFDQKKCGQQLALLHQKSQSDQYGLEVDNYIGSTPQSNRRQSDWVTFFREQRILPQVKLAQRKGACDRSRSQQLSRFTSKLDDWLGGVPRKPSLLHGDLWGGNVIGDQNHNPVLIDPAVYYGDREADVAFTLMFGGFSREFYQTYQETYPMEPGYQDRFEIYNVYHILNHLNLFGESYGYSLDSLLRRLVG